MSTQFLIALVIAFLAAGAFAAAAPTQNSWETFKIRFNKTYEDTVEEKERQLTWLDNLAAINEHNERFNLGAESFTLGMNKFGDLTGDEFAQIYNGYRMQPRRFHPRGRVLHSVSDIPATVDWRTQGVVTPIKDQGQCGSCWAFSATGSLEGQHAMVDKKLVSLSEQNLVDCSGSEGNDGCGGGLMDQAFEYIIKNKGIDTEASYAYTASDGKCHFKSNEVGATLKSFTDVASNDENALATAIATIGPISVAIDASHTSFQFYKSGVYFEKDCSSTQLDHGVLAVGYGSQDGQDFYIVKNSWGNSWGNAGYILMSRNKSNNCGIATDASYPTV